ncbi:NADH pyrophosphatase [Roseovarius litorisediminis]|uniref:NAD(+) diphosphatase n=1 Tax=Roseovarius litorisediminis TaxID=1312363 RepID=A0A1Y5TBZ9_9RHOB|nr:NAD(+) diphosphatase [Roseovarius litorisediminis]SLN60506.1 NADH pyrophosphatase [Roseovarius litorisediminis]
MKRAETVTFGGSTLDRAAELRGDATALAKLTSEGCSKSILLWRGKPLVRAEALDRLVRLPMDHPVLTQAVSPPILLGREETGDLIFASDISGWQPEELDEAALGQFLDATEQQHPDLPAETVFAELRRIMTRLSPRDAELAATAKAVASWHVSHRFCAQCGSESQMVMAGWQRSCSVCGGQHFPRTDPVVIMLITNGNSVLMGRSPGWPEGMYSLLAGFVEPGETLEAAVRREVFEEAGIMVGQVEYLASQPWAFPSSLMFGCRGTALNHHINIDPTEIEDAIWITREDMMQAFAGNHPFLAPARKGAIAQFLLANWLADTLD